MDKKLRKNILTILRDKKARINLISLKDILRNKYMYTNEGTISNSFSSQVTHMLQVLEGELLIRKEKDEPFIIGGGPDWDTYIELTAKGYEEFHPWYKNAWSFINDDLTKLLSLIALILSIIATYISLSK